MIAPFRTAPRRSPVLLLAAGAPAQRPDIGLFARHLHNGLNIGTLALFSVLVFIAGVTVHPLQFGLAQILEGYWGRYDLRLALPLLTYTLVYLAWAPVGPGRFCSPYPDARAALRPPEAAPG